MPVTFKVPKQTAKSVYNIDEFKGVDLTNSPTNVDDNKSPNAINMIRDVPGKVRKRMGFEVVEDYVNPSSYLNNYCDISFNSNRYSYISREESYHLDPLALRWVYGEISKFTTDVYINYDSDAKTVTLDGTVCDNMTVYNRRGISTIVYPEYDRSYEVVIAKDVPVGTYKMTPIFMSGTMNGYITIKVGGVEYDINEDRTTEDVVLTAKSDLSIIVGKHGQGTHESSANKVTFDNFVFGINIVETSKYQDDQPYIPAGSNTPTDLRINGCHYRREDTYPLYHIGTQLIQNGVVKYTGMANNISHSWQFNENLYIQDGKKLLVYDGETVEPVSNQATIPLVTISRDPIWGQGGGGGGEPDQDFNLMTPWFTESFVVTADTASATQFPMSVQPLGDGEVVAEVMDANGEFVTKTEGTDFDVNRTTGIITFHTAPGRSPIDGHDNVKITAQQSTTDYDDRINKCTFGARFGVNGAYDRLFVSGNPDYPNFDWHSEIWDLKYFPDSSYSTLGSSKSAVVGYSIVSNYLAAHKDELEEDMSVIVREGDYIDDEASFRIINSLQGAGAISSNSFAYLCTEPLFLTRSGLYAITAQDITGEKYAQSRSFYLNGKLTKEDFANLQKSFCVIFNDMYILCVNERKEPDDPNNLQTYSRLYILDGLQPMRTDKSEPYSTRQYAGFYCEMENINCFWERENRLYFGTVTGKVCRFYNDKNSIYSYNDGGQPIYCQWETPDIDGQLFYKNKTLRYIALRAGAAIATSVEIWGMDRGIWKFIKRDNAFGNYLSFPDIQFSKFSFSGSKEQKISRTKVKIKKVDKYRLRFVNQELNEPFSLYDLANEYIENGNYKG